MASDSPPAILPPRAGAPFTGLLRDTLRNPLRLFGLILLAYLAFIAFNNIRLGEYEVDQLARNLIFGLAQGSIYALIALGYTLVYGVLLMINFAHGEVFMSGAYIGFFAITATENSGLLQSQPGLALLITFAVGIAASVTVAVLLERVAYRPLRGAPRLVPLITAIGASIALQQIFFRLFGASTRRYPDVNLYAFSGQFPNQECQIVDGVEACRGIDLISGRYDVQFLGLELRILPIHFLVFFTAVGFMIALWFFVQRTKTGKAMRAVAEDKATAALMGIDVDRVIVTTFVLGAVMAGAGGVLFALYNQQVSPFMGFIPGIKAFTAAVFGGIGSIPGAMFGGLSLGIIETVLPGMLGIPSQLKDVIAFGMLVLILVFRPSGLLGASGAQKKV